MELLKIPTPLCKKHQHEGKTFEVTTTSGWKYIVIPTPLGSLVCTECNDKLSVSQPDLRDVALIGADLSFSNIHEAKNIDKAHWNNSTTIDEKFKKLLNKEMFLE